MYCRLPWHQRRSRLACSSMSSGPSLVGAAEVGVEPHPPAAAHQERGLDVVVAHDVAAERRRPGEHRQMAARREGAHPHKSVVAPERPRGPLHRGQPAGEDRRVQRGRELHRAREERAGAHHARQRLEEAEARVGLHPPDHLDDGAALHQAVGVEDQRVVVGPARAGDELGDVAGLAARVVGAPAVEDAALPAALGQQPREPVGFGARRRPRRACPTARRCRCVHGSLRPRSRRPWRRGGRRWPAGPPDRSASRSRCGRGWGRRRAGGPRRARGRCRPSALCTAPQASQNMVAPSSAARAASIG